MNTRPQVTPPTTFVARRDPIFGKYWVPANHWLRMIYAALLRVKCIRDCLGEHATGSPVTLTETPQSIRAADSFAVETYILNEGEREAQVYEGGGLLFYLGAGKGKKLPMPGYLALTAKASGSAAMAVGFSTGWIYDGGQDLLTITLVAPPSLTLSPGDTIRFGSANVYTTHEVVSLVGTTLTASGFTSGDPVKIVYKELEAVVAAYTTRRCLCGDAVAYYDDAPVGAFLL